MSIDQSETDRVERERGQIEQSLNHAEGLYRDATDPYQQQHGYTLAAQAYRELAGHTKDPTWRNAALQAAERYDALAAQIRFRYTIPTLFPKREAALLFGGESPDGIHIAFGPTPTNADEARHLGQGTSDLLSETHQLRPE